METLKTESGKNNFATPASMNSRPWRRTRTSSPVYYHTREFWICLWVCVLHINALSVCVCVCTHSTSKSLSCLLLSSSSCSVMWQAFHFYLATIVLFSVLLQIQSLRADSETFATNQIAKAMAGKALHTCIIEWSLGNLFDWPVFCYYAHSAGPSKQDWEEFCYQVRTYWRRLFLQENSNRDNFLSPARCIVWFSQILRQFKTTSNDKLEMKILGLP